VLPILGALADVVGELRIRTRVERELSVFFELDRVSKASESQQV
jgi:hypothetical protein